MQIAMLCQLLKGVHLDTKLFAPKVTFKIIFAIFF